MDWDQYQQRLNKQFPLDTLVKVVSTGEDGIVVRTSTQMVYINIDGVGVRGFFPEDVEILKISET